MSTITLRKTILTQSLMQVLSRYSTSVLSASGLMLFATINSHAETPTVQQLDTIMLEANAKAHTAQVKFNGSLSGLSKQDLAYVPASISRVDAEQIEAQQAKVLGDVIQQDAAVGENYAPIGYYPNVVTRGFVLGQASSYFVNSQLVRGEQNVALENKQQVDILKGISAMQSGLSTSGGVIHYVTKRPEAQIGSLNLDVDEYGDNTVAVDVGDLFGAAQQFGFRVNLANQNLRPYVDNSNGSRQFGALALDWQVNPRSKLEFDLEAQKQQQASVPGYQLLDGKVPTGVSWERRLGEQSGVIPVTNRSLNSSLHYQYQFNDAWTGRLSAAHSQAVLDDYSSFAWGCYSEICDYSGLGNSFDKHGNYDIYNYRNPNDRYVTDQFKAALSGEFATGGIAHQLNLELTQTQKQHKKHAEVNQLLATGNIYSGVITPVIDPETEEAVKPITEVSGERYKALQTSQSAVMVVDQINWHPQWSSILGGTWLRLNEKAYTPEGAQARKTEMDKFLPQLALMYQPWEDTHVYASYSKGLTDGGMAPFYTENAFEVLAPMNSRQYEIGVKQQINDYLITAAVFDIKQDNQSLRYNADDSLSFVAQGKQQNYGLELGLQGKVTDALKINSSLAYTHARLVDIDTAELKGHQLQNVPSIRLNSFASYDVAAVNGLSVLGGWRYSGSKYANAAGTAKVSGYSVLDLGAAYRFQLSQHDATVRFNLDNVFNKQYWRDAGSFIGDDYLFLGTPRTAKLALNLKY